jgi:hypothetical protein
MTVTESAKLTWCRPNTLSTSASPGESIKETTHCITSKTSWGFESAFARGNWCTIIEQAKPSYAQSGMVLSCWGWPMKRTSRTCPNRHPILQEHFVVVVVLRAMRVISNPNHWLSGLSDGRCGKNEQSLLLTGERDLWLFQSNL